MRITVDGESYTQPLEIIKDPSSTGSEADIRSQVSLQLRIRDDINASSDMVNQIEWMRKQLDDVQKMLRTDKAKAELLKQVQAMDQKMQGVEYEFLSKPLAASDDKTYISAWKVYYNLLWLNGEIGSGAGDVAGGTDFRPTDTEVQLAHEYEQELAKDEGDYHNLMTKDLPAFNRTRWISAVSPSIDCSVGAIVPKSNARPASTSWDSVDISSSSPNRS